MSNQLVNDKDNTPVPNPLAAITFFFIVTSIYCIFSIFIQIDSTTGLMMKTGYILFVIIGQYFINLNLSQTLCGTRQWNSVLYVTIIPWILIFVVLHSFLYIFPGWMTPFSNTFGYLVAKLMGLPELMDKILAPIDNDKTSQALLNVSNDSSILINQFMPESVTTEFDENGNEKRVRTRFDNAWDKLKTGKILNIPENTMDDPNKENKLKSKLYGFVHMKYCISEYVWNILTGFLVTSVSYNYIINNGCRKSPKEMENRYERYKQETDKKEMDKAAMDEKEPNYIA